MRWLGMERMMAKNRPTDEKLLWNERIVLCRRTVLGLMQDYFQRESSLPFNTLNMLFRVWIEAFFMRTSFTSLIWWNVFLFSSLFVWWCEAYKHKETSRARSHVWHGITSIYYCHLWIEEDEWPIRFFWPMRNWLFIWFLMFHFIWFF